MTAGKRALIFGIGGQSSGALSFQKPAETMERITVGAPNILEAMRFAEWPIRPHSAGAGDCFGDARKAARELGWRTAVTMQEVARRMADAMAKART